MALHGRVVKGMIPRGGDYGRDHHARRGGWAAAHRLPCGPRARAARRPGHRAGDLGVNSHIKRVCDGFAADGYVALAPGIFERVEPGFAIGYRPEDIERGRAVRMKIPLEAMVKDVRAAVKALTAEKLKVGVVGYCLGGTLALLAAPRIDGVP